MACVASVAWPPVRVRVCLRRDCCVPGLLKIDIDAAFRRIPLKPAHRWAAGVAFATMLEVRVHAKAAHWMS